jgi:hypothetical protein
VERTSCLGAKDSLLRSSCSWQASRHLILNNEERGVSLPPPARSPPQPGLVGFIRQSLAFLPHLRHVLPPIIRDLPFVRVMKVYHGRRTEHGCAVDVEEDGECYALNPRLDLQNHSPIVSPIMLSNQVIGRPFQLRPSGFPLGDLIIGAAG